MNKFSCIFVAVTLACGVVASASPGAGAISHANISLTTPPPQWNLKRHFPYYSISDPQIQKDLEASEDRLRGFYDQFKGRLSTLLVEALVEYETISEIIDIPICYAFLIITTHIKDAKSVQLESSIKTEHSRLISEYASFLEIEIANLPTEIADAQLTRHPEGGRLAPYVHRVQLKQKHQLSEDVERAISIRNSWAGALPVADHYQRVLGSTQFQVDGFEKSLGLDEVLDLLIGKNAGVRKNAIVALDQGLASSGMMELASVSLNITAGSWAVECKERGFSIPRSRRNFMNNEDDSVVDALLKSVREDAVDLARRYYRLKKAVLAKISKLENFGWADRLAPIDLAENSRIFTWNETIEIVLQGYKRFSPKMAVLLGNLLDEERIDARPSPDKRVGAYNLNCGAKIGQFQFLSFVGSVWDVKTFAHEAGHGCHGILSAKQGNLQLKAPITLSESASIMGETVVLQELLETAETLEQKFELLMHILDSSLSSIVRQCSMDRFEELVHAARKDGVISAERLSNLWIQATVEYYGAPGDVFDDYEHVKNLWAYVHHFHGRPFYVYSYAFGHLLVGALYGHFKRHPLDFEDNYIAFLEAGSTKTLKELFKPFGMNPTYTQFWKDAVHVSIGQPLEEAEKLAVELNLI